METAKDFIAQDDIEFGHIDSYKFPKTDLDSLNLSVFQEEGYQVRVYRRRNLKDYKDYPSS